MIGGRRVREYRRATLTGLVLTLAVWTLVAAVVVGLLVAGWPLVIAAVCGFALAWWRGWPSRRLVASAAWCLPMLVAFALAYRFRGNAGWGPAAWSPFRAWQHAWHALFLGEWLRAMVIIAPTAIPAGLLIAALCWRLRVGMMAAGAAGWWPGAPVAFDERQWRRQVATAGQRVRAPGGVPVLSRGHPVIGAVIRAVGHHPRPLLRLPYGTLRTHMLIVGTTGAGKTTALIRLWAAFWAAATARFRKGAEAPPWLVVIDAKGGFDSRDTAHKTQKVLRDLGAQRVGIWPDEVTLNLWALPPAVWSRCCVTWCRSPPKARPPTTPMCWPQWSAWRCMPRPARPPTRANSCPGWTPGGSRRRTRVMTSTQARCGRRGARRRCAAAVPHPVHPAGAGLRRRRERDRLRRAVLHRGRHRVGGGR